jgi:signal transduction histidine kinase
VTEDRWITCSVRDDIEFGLRPGDELKIETTICNDIRKSHEAVVIDHVAEDPLYAHHHTPAIYGFQSYISMPIILRDGTFFGTLCAIDPRPARLRRPEIIGMFKLFAELIAFHLDTQQRLRSSEAALEEELRTSELREQFIAVLGHDLKNPLASIDAGARMLARKPDEDKTRMLLDAIQGSVARMAKLIDNVLDLARGRLGGGIALERQPEETLQPVLEPVIEELRASHADRRIDSTFDLTEPVKCDAVRIGQLLSNLLGNALTHGSPEGPIDVRASTANGMFELSVSNRGEPIPPAIMDNLFKPFVRASYKPSVQGLGLGLYIASEIASAHGGTLAVASSCEETRITFRMPLC